MIDIKAWKYIMVLTGIVSIGTSNPATKYTQNDILQRLNIQNDRVKDLFSNSHIRTRHLILPNAEDDEETQSRLLQKHLSGCLEVGGNAIIEALDVAGLKVSDIDYLCVVTSTGFLTPALSAHFMSTMKFRNDCQRVDIVGMGCNGGLNGLNTLNSWSKTNPKKYALLLCTEICSAAYVNDGSMNASVVNSLFGDGAAALIVTADEHKYLKDRPVIHDFNSYMIPNSLNSMFYQWNSDSNKFGFHLSNDIPYAIGANVEIPITQLLDKFNLKKRDISHWTIHAGGKKVIDAIMYNLGLTSSDLKHTINILRNYGNVSSGSFLFSFKSLIGNCQIQPNEYGVMMTMGPGAQIETALIQW
jgi:3,5-dihydroxyphenylacetyl-CoA synthase